MPVIGCPCGAHVADPDNKLTYWTTSLIETILAAVAGKASFLGLLASFVGQPLDAETLCSSQRPDMPTFTFSDFVLLANGTAKVRQALTVAAYNELCECDDCPPITDCGQGDNCYTITQEWGYWATNEVQKVYHIPAGAELWPARSDGYCLGLKNGLWVYWTYSEPFGGSITGINVRAGDDFAPGQSWSVATYGAGVTICPSGEQVPDDIPWPEPPAGVGDWLGPPACSNSDICTALDYVYEAVRRIEFLVGVVAGPLYGVTAPYEIVLPGIGTPIAGTLAEVLPRALTAIAPIQASQLVDPVTVEVTEASLIDVAGLAYVNIAPTVVPASAGKRGLAETEIYYSNHRNPGPGWVLVLGQEGVLARHEILYPTGVEFALPSTATDLAIEVGAGVTLSITTWEREV